jgi:site-specific recombinase XerC
MHMLRHALASSMLAAGVPMLEVQAFLGHKDVTTTLGTYGHLLPGALEDAASVYDSVWEKARSKGGEQAATGSGDAVVVPLRRRSALDEH